MPDDQNILIHRMKQDEMDLIAVRDGGWIKLYRHRKTLVFWDSYLSDPGYHGGGSSVLEEVDADYVTENYNNINE